MPGALPQASPREHSLAGLPGQRAPVLCAGSAFPRGVGRAPGVRGGAGGRPQGAGGLTEEPRERVAAGSRAE